MFVPLDTGAPFYACTPPAVWGGKWQPSVRPSDGCVQCLAHRHVCYPSVRENGSCWNCAQSRQRCQLVCGTYLIPPSSQLFRPCLDILLVANNREDMGSYAGHVEAVLHPPTALHERVDALQRALVPLLVNSIQAQSLAARLESMNNIVFALVSCLAMLEGHQPTRAQLAAAAVSSLILSSELDLARVAHGLLDPEANPFTVLLEAACPLGDPESLSDQLLGPLSVQLPTIESTSLPRPLQATPAATRTHFPSVQVVDLRDGTHTESSAKEDRMVEDDIPGVEPRSPQSSP
jgi:hypothetical protein